MRRLLAGFVCGLAAGLGLGWGLTGDAAPAPPPSRPRPPASPAPPPPPSALPDAVERPVSELAAEVEEADRAPALPGALAAAIGCSHEDHGPEAHPEQLAALVAADPSELEAALAQVPGASIEELELLVLALGFVRRPEVEELAAGLALDDPAPERRALGVELLGRLGTPRALPVLDQVLGQESATPVLRVALGALPRPVAVSEAEGARLRGKLEGFAASPTPELRRRALIALADWSPDTGLARAALAGDPDPAVRAGAAYALELAGGGSAADRELLARVLEDVGEPFVVRDNAWRALGAAGPLPASMHAAWHRFAREREGLALD